MIDDLIKQQHRHFGLDYEGPPRTLDPAEEAFRTAAMMEELSELILADDLVSKYDALLDLIVFAAGTLERMGLPIERGLAEVIEANRRKQLGPNSHKRGSFKLDLVKPADWQPPRLIPIIELTNIQRHLL